MLYSAVIPVFNFHMQLINRTLLANQRAITKLFSNLMKSELNKELSHRWKWQDTVKTWKLIQGKYVADSFRSDILQLYFGAWMTRSDYCSPGVSIDSKILSFFHYKSKKLKNFSILFFLPGMYKTYFVCVFQTWNFPKWCLLRCALSSYREFMASEEIQNPPAVKTEVENMITGQILLSERRLELLQHLGYDKRESRIKGR